MAAPVTATGVENDGFGEFVDLWSARNTSTASRNATFSAMIVVALPGLIWLSRHSERRSNVVRVVLTAGGFTAMLIGGMGFGHYLILLSTAGGLAATMPVKPDARLFPQRLSPTAVGRATGHDGGGHARVRLRHRPLAAAITPGGRRRVLPRCGQPQPRPGPRLPARVASPGLGLGDRTPWALMMY